MRCIIIVEHALKKLRKLNFLPQITKEKKLTACKKLNVEDDQCQSSENIICANK